MMKHCYIYLFDGFSDWEIGYLTPEIVKSETCDIVTFSINGGAVRSMGGLNVAVNKSISAVNIADVDMLVLPGGNMWDNGADKAVVSMITELNDANKPIAAICAATAQLARLGLLDNVKHTSNALGYLQWAVPTYKGEANYVDVPALTDKNIITASGIMPVDFAREVFRMLHLKSDADIEKWYQLFKNNVWIA